MKRIEQRNLIRVDNQIKILDALKQGRKTLTELASVLGVSFTATSRIVDELTTHKLLRSSEKKISKKTRGRTPVFVELNNDLGVVCCIDFSAKDIRIILATLDSALVNEAVLPGVSYIQKEHLLQIEMLIKDLLLRPENKNRPLLSICIAAPGLIRSTDYEIVLSRRVESFNRINPVLYFANAFNVLVEMHNDVRLGCLAELKSGSFPKKPFNGLFIHLGISAGLALIFNGRIYKGSNNFSGEIPVYVGEDEIIKQSFWNGRFFPIREINNRIHELRDEEILDAKESIDINRLVEDFASGDPKTTLAIEESIKRNALTIAALSTILDVEYIVIEGRILNFGPSYIDLLRKYMHNHSGKEIRSQILISTLKEKSCAIGACYHASSMYLLNQIENITRKRISSQSFALDASYREI